MTPLINGINYSWSNISVILFGAPVTGIVSIDYKATQKKENNYGAGNEPVSRGYGAKEYEGSIELYVDTWKQIIAAAPNRDPMQIAPFDIQVAFAGASGGATVDALKMVEFMEDPLTASQGDTKLTVKIPLIIGAIKR